MKLTESISDTSNLFNWLKILLSKPLPGMKAQLLMAPKINDNRFNMDKSKAPVYSSILILFYLRKGEVTTLFIRRPDYPGVHGGQISYPGGRMEMFDKDSEDTALRETEEEIGIKGVNIKIAGSLTQLYIPPSNYLVKPFVGVTKPNPIFTPEPSEVSEIVEVPLKKLLSPNCIKQTPPSPEFKFMEVPAYFINGVVIWGATAMITSELLAIINKSLPSVKEKT